MAGSATTQTMVLSSGGLRSLVALGLVHREELKQRRTLVFIDDGRPSRRRAADAAARQAEAFGVNHSVELSMTHIYAGPPGRGQTDHGEREPTPVLAAAQVLLAAVSYARRHGADRLIYPASHGLDPEPLSRATERLLLIEQLAGEEDSQRSSSDEAERSIVETPLCDLSDQQVVELGGQLELDFSLSWSCRADAPRPCQTCRACKRRKAAFDRAGIEDPLLKGVSAAA